MAEEIKVPCRLAAHTTQNANAYYGRLAMTSNNFQPFGIVLPNGKDSRVNFMMSAPIPTNINATPAGILRLIWTPGATGNFKIFYDISVAQLDVTDLDISAGTLSGNVTKAVTGTANDIQSTGSDIALTSLAASLVSNRIVFGWIEWKSLSDPGASPVAAKILINQILFVANT